MVSEFLFPLAGWNLTCPVSARYFLALMWMKARPFLGVASCLASLDKTLTATLAILSPHVAVISFTKDCILVSNFAVFRKSIQSMPAVSNPNQLEALKLGYAMQGTMSLSQLSV